MTSVVLGPLYHMRRFVPQWASLSREAKPCQYRQRPTAAHVVKLSLGTVEKNITFKMSDDAPCHEWFLISRCWEPMIHVNDLAG